MGAANRKRELERRAFGRENRRETTSDRSREIELTALLLVVVVVVDEEND